MVMLSNPDNVAPDVSSNLVDARMLTNTQFALHDSSRCPKHASQCQAWNLREQLTRRMPYSKLLHHHVLHNRLDARATANRCGVRTPTCA